MKIVCIGAGYVGVSCMRPELLVMTEGVHLYSHTSIGSIVSSLLYTTLVLTRLNPANGMR